MNRSDWEALTARPSYVRLGGGLWRPKERILGSDIAGTVEAVGSEVASFQPGDEVLGDVLYQGHGGFAEYVVVSERAPIVTKPSGITFAHAAALPQGAVLALQGLLAKLEVQAGHQVLINGGGGGAGTFALQIAKSMGAEVTGVDSGDKLDVMRSAGADHVVDYKAEDFTRSGQRYDRILVFVGSRSIFAQRRALKPGGVYLMVGGSTPRLLQAVVVGWLITKLSDRRWACWLPDPIGTISPTSLSWSLPEN